MARPNPEKELQQVVDWNLIDKEDYLSAMERSQSTIWRLNI